MLLLSFALAAPPVPELSARGFAAGVAVTGGAVDDLLTDTTCAEGGNCEALRHRAGWGGLLTLQIAPFFSVWAEAGTEEVKAPSLEYSSTGYQVQGGASANLRPHKDVGALAWGEVDYGASGTEVTSSARRWRLKAGGAARFGQPDALLSSWLGAELVVSGDDVTSTLAGQLDVDLEPTVPFNVVAGAELFSEPMGGPGSTAPMLLVTATGTAGAELSARFALGAAF